MSPTTISIKDRLQRAASVMKTAAVLGGTFGWAGVCLGLWLLLFLADNILALPAGLRLPLAVSAAAFTVAVFVRRIVRPALQPRRLTRAAVQIERRYGIRDNVVINACQFEGRTLSAAERVFVTRTHGEALRALGAVTEPALWNRRHLGRWGAFAGAVLLAWTVYSVALPTHAINAFARFARPLGDVPPAASVLVRTLPDANLTVAEGQDVRVSAWLERDRAVLTGDAAAPVIVWSEAARSVAPARGASDGEPMPKATQPEGHFTYTFRDVRRSFAFRVFAAGTYAPSVHVTVRPPPRLTSSLFRLTPPDYTGRPAVERPGPPAALSGLPGTRVEVTVEIDRDVKDTTWLCDGTNTAFTGRDRRWQAATTVAAAGAYAVEARVRDLPAPLPIARGEVMVEADRSPAIDFVTDDRNRFVNPGTRIELELQASDDYGLRGIDVTARTGQAEGVPFPIKQWPYMGPPGRSGSVTERVGIDIDPRVFAPGETYLVEAAATDFSPAGEPGRSRPVLIRVRALQDIAVPRGDALAKAFDLLRQTVEDQKRAIGLTANLSADLAQAIERKTLASHREQMNKRQDEARGRGRAAADAFRQVPDGAPYASRVAVLADDEMTWVLGDIDKLPAGTAAELPGLLARIAGRQDHILMELIALLGRIAAERQAAAAGAAVKTDNTAPTVTAEDAGKALRDDMKEFERSQERILEVSRMLLDKGPEDLTTEEEEILGKLAREEAEWAQFFEEKLTDFSKLPMQEFADGSIAKEINEVYQEVKLAAKSLYEKDVEIAVPQEQAGLENAEELVQNLERWLPDTPDHEKWSMEEPLQPADVAVAELPSELEDIVGELLDREEEMTEDVEDVTSSWMDSFDKGAGWDATDGPISGMSAKGVTGNRLPNDMEVGGRAGEGRSGRSNGQMVEDSASGKDGRDTPSRVTPSPFEPGSIKDESEKSPGGATGGGKMAGYAEQGLRGPAPAPRLEDMARLGSTQTQIRQDAESLALKLRAYNLPTGDLELSVASMRRLEEASAKGDGLGVRRAYSTVMDALADARTAIRTEVGMHRESSTLHDWQRDEIMSGLRDGSPRGYEDMIARYFRALAEINRTPAPPARPPTDP